MKRQAEPTSRQSSDKQLLVAQIPAVCRRVDCIARRACCCIASLVSQSINGVQNTFLFRQLLSGVPKRPTQPRAPISISEPWTRMNERENIDQESRDRVCATSRFQDHGKSWLFAKTRRGRVLLHFKTNSVSLTKVMFEDQVDLDHRLSFSVSLFYTLHTI